MDETAPIQCDKIDIDLANSEKQPITAEDTAIMQRLIAEIGAEKLRGLSARDYMQVFVIVSAFYGVREHVTTFWCL